ncbi:hypothetical protein F4803DRAFT_572161 [Xylaria telfairii]|nr:hypothetical protein F4803DRAFT_572161 [Xylaria telfairii]
MVSGATTTPVRFASFPVEIQLNGQTLQSFGLDNSSQANSSESAEQPHTPAPSIASSAGDNNRTPVLSSKGHGHSLGDGTKTPVRVSLDPVPPQRYAPITIGPVIAQGSRDGETPRPGSLNEALDPKLPLPLKESLGMGGYITIIGGHMGIVAIVGFLTFLWFGYGPSPEAARATRSWREIALNDWMTQAISLSALVLRFIISFQTVVCTSMIASLVLEKRFVRRSRVSHFSILRGINDGPTKLLKLMMSSGIGIFRFLEFWLLLFVFVVTLGLQFSATILLLDLNEFLIEGNETHAQVPSLLTYNKNDSTLGVNTDCPNRYELNTRGPIYQLFAEAPSDSDATPNSNGFSDTGLVQRAFLPQAEPDDRTSLRQLDGNLMTMNSRVVCVRPVMDTFYQVSVPFVGFGHVATLTGRLHYAESLEAAGVPAELLCTSSECQEVSFQCSIPMALKNTWESMACVVGGVGGQWWGLNLAPKLSPVEEPWSPNSTIYMVFTSNMRRDVDWSIIPDQGSLDYGEVYGEWLSFEPVTGRHLNVSVCFAAFNMDRQLVHVTADSVLKEPEITWSLTSSKYDTSNAQRFFGVDVPHRPHGERGILTMNIIGQPDDGPPGNPAYDVITFRGVSGIETNTVADLTTRVLEHLVDFQLSENKAFNDSLVLCYTCDGLGDREHPSISILFTSIIAETSRAANAVSVYMTVAASTLYDAYRSSLGQMQKATIVATKIVRTPGPCDLQGRCGGFYTVVALVAAHLCFITIITLLFARQAQYSRLDNIWHTVSQLVGEELSAVL